ncbi:hypothetical protein GCM10010129_84350 [Streptomyces fumigatiscleroticus]|nr:hypothetical protein GCM10010129_84350 [Streptomyces fumigatiscleroticus]
MIHQKISQEMQAVFLGECTVREEPWRKRALGAGRRDDDPHSARSKSVYIIRAKNKK